MTDRQGTGLEDSSQTSIAVAVCTYRRNDMLRTLLEAVVENVAHLGGRAAVGVVVVDDTSAGEARPVVEPFVDRFELGLVYRISGRQNISLARNMALESAVEMAEWTAMTDDDCAPVPAWLEQLIQVQRLTEADAVAGPMIRRVPPGAPKWLEEEPFLEAALFRAEDGEEIGTGSTHNALISNRWLKEHPTTRFDPAFGVVGGEDMVFYHEATDEGMRVHYAARAIVHENEPPSRATFGYQLWNFFWLGNSSQLTNRRSGTGSMRLFLRSLNALRRAVQRPFVRLVRGENPQLRYCLAQVLQALGMMVAVPGIEVRHH